MAASSLATLRSKIEADLRGRVASPFAYRDRNAFELVSTGIPEMDALVGGLPRGAMTEICGAACSGRTSLLLSALASRTADGEVCALVDARDSFDPQEPRVIKRVQKGGSFLCTNQYCERYMPGARGKGDPETGTNHVGFRCVRAQ